MNTVTSPLDSFLINRTCSINVTVKLTLSLIFTRVYGRELDLFGYIFGDLRNFMGVNV